MVSPDTVRQWGLLIAAAPLALGINALLRPRAALTMIGYRASASPTPSPVTTTKNGKPEQTS
ncbi:hypothetical protein Micbo1qcDRAFT_169410, partial [Microdochium bolleyi]